MFLIELRRAWENVVELDLAVVRVESNPQLVQIVPPNEVVVLISFELTIGDLRGMMNLCIPFNSIERIGGKLSSNSWVTYGTRQRLAGIDPADQQQLARLAGRTGGPPGRDDRSRPADLIGLRVGDIITTEKDMHSPIAVSVEGVSKFVARPGAFKGRKAIQIDAPGARRRKKNCANKTCSCQRRPGGTTLRSTEGCGARARLANTASPLPTDRPGGTTLRSSEGRDKRLMGRANSCVLLYAPSPNVCRKARTGCSIAARFRRPALLRLIAPGPWTPGGTAL